MKLKKFHIYYIFINLLLSLYFIQCYSSKPTSNNKKIIASNENILNTQFYFYKNTDTSSIFYMLLKSSNLLYTRLDTGVQFFARIKVLIHLNSLTNSRVDTVSKIFYIPQNQDTFFTHFHIPANNDNYTVKITITDLNRKEQYQYLTDLKLDNNNYRNNFLITINDKMLFKPYLTENAEVKIYHRKKYPHLYVDVFKYNHNPAPPPFAHITPSFNYLPDSSFVLSITDNQYYLLKIQSQRFYHIRLSQNTLDGLTIFSTDSVFPDIKNAREMLYTARYIMNKNEFEKCHQLNTIHEIKSCIDNFWIQIAGSKERARTLIKNYYKKVIEANSLYTSYKYGWQTDRGMIYIIFGPPEEVYKSFNTEKWYYSINGQKNALVFNFNKNKNNPFTTSDYVLERSDYYKDIWYLQVDKIREGRLRINN